MGHYGNGHTDGHDSPTGFSCIIPVSDLTGEPGEEPGRFHFISRGFYVVLEPMVTIFFSGRQLHGGTAPLAPPGKVAPSWALRCILVGYPSRAILEGSARHCLAALPHRAEPVYLTPEMTGVKCV